MSFLLRFLVCTLIVAATSVLAALAWDQSDQATPDAPGKGTAAGTTRSDTARNDATRTDTAGAR